MKLSDMVATNETVACEPFPPRTTAQHAPVAGARAKSVGTPGGQGTVLVPLRVLSGNRDVLHQLRKGGILVRPGDLVFVRAEDCVQPWASSVVKVEGIDKPLILVPIRNVLMVYHDSVAFNAALAEPAPSAQPSE